MKKAVKHHTLDFLKKHPTLRKSVRFGSLAYKKFHYAQMMKRFVVQPALIVFESFMGRNYNCSPKAIYQLMVKDPRFTQYDFVWAFEDLEKAKALLTEYPELNLARLVEYRSPEYFRVYATAGIFITNSRLPEEIVRKKEQIFVQCWHGTPLKRLGHDVIENSENSLNTSAEMKKKSDLDAVRYSYLLSQSTFCTEKLTSAFNLPKNNRTVQILEEGYPRNDYLFHFTEADVAMVKQTLGIHADDRRKIILYAPTWRDNQHDSSLGYTYQLNIDFDRWAKKFAKDYIILFRTHYFVANSFDFGKYADFVFDVSNFNDINQLYIVSDLLITDYSSVFFDYANLKRPILFYMYDLLEYQGKLRDFYFDLKELPGNIYKNENDLLAAIEGLDFARCFDARYQAFNNKFNYLDDGQATRRVVDALLQTMDQTREMQKSASGHRSSFKKTTLKKSKDLVTAMGKRAPWVRKSALSLYEMFRKNKYQNFMKKHSINPKQIIFESYMGKSYACSPKALFQYMCSHSYFDDYTLIWAFKNPQKAIGLFPSNPELARAVLVEYGSDEYYKAYATSAFFISNSRLPNYITKKKGQTYVQTWHGSTFKKLGYDIQLEGYNALSSTEFLRRQYDRDASRYDFLVSPSPFCSETYKTGFNLVKNNKNVTIIEEGYPRDDFLLNHTKDDVDRIKRNLGIPETEKRKIILYAPTWRDSDHKTGVGYVLDLPLDFDRLKEMLENDFIILFRAHYFIANAFDFKKYQGFIYDVSGQDDINDLFVTSDLLVTDYSSAFYDYANLNRRIVFYMYDFDSFSGAVRDFYLPLDELPGPIAKDQQSLIKMLIESKEMFVPDEKYHQFNKRFNPLHDGRSSERVLHRIFPSLPTHLESEDA